MGEQIDKAIQFFKNEIKQHESILKGALNDEYGEYIENRMLFYKTAAHAIENYQVFKTVFPDMTKEDIKLIEKCLEELLQYKKLGTVEEIKQRLGEK